jgi:hypothetical protein
MFRVRRWVSVVSSMEGSRVVSLYAGTTMLKSTSAGSSKWASGRGVSGHVRERYVFSSARVTMGEGVNNSKRICNCFFWLATFSIADELKEQDRGFQKCMQSLTKALRTHCFIVFT